MTDAETRRPADVWASGDAYEPYVGRWSRLVARELPRLARRAARQPLARRRLRHRRAEPGDPRHAPSRRRSSASIPPRASSPTPARRFDDRRARVRGRRRPATAASPDARSTSRSSRAGAELRAGDRRPRPSPRWSAVARPGGDRRRVRLGLRRRDAVHARTSGTPRSRSTRTRRELDEGRRFPICQPEPLGALFRDGRAGRRSRCARSTCRPCSATSTTTGRRFSAVRAPRRHTPCRSARSAAPPCAIASARICRSSKTVRSP